MRIVRGADLSRHVDEENRGDKDVWEGTVRERAGTNVRLDLSLTWRVSEDPLKRPDKYDHRPNIHGEPRRVSLPFGKAQLAGS